MLTVVGEIFNDFRTKAKGYTVDEIKEEELYEEFTKRDIPFLQRLEDNG